MTDMDNKFWSIDMFDDNFRKYLNNKQYRGELFPKIFMCLTFITLISYIIRSITTRVLTFSTYVPNYYFVQSMQLIFITIAYIIIIGYDMLLISMCLYTNGQFLMVGEKIRETCKTNNAKELNIIIVHHQFLLE